MTDALATALDGVRVVALATNIPGPLAAARLRSMGASVTKVEPLAGDPLESASQRWYAAICAGLDVVRINPREPKERDGLYERVREADVLLTTMRGSALSRLGLGWDDTSLAVHRGSFT